MIVVLENLLSDDLVATLRVRLLAGPWQDGAASAGELARAVKHNRQLDARSPLAHELGADVLRRVVGDTRFISAALPHSFFPPRFNRYAAGEAYGLHVDSAIMGLPDGGGSLRCDLSATLFLSPPDDYDGGVLEIETAFGAQQIKLAAGALVLYPASSLHRVTAVTRGERLACFFWVQSLVAAEPVRTALHDLDQAIQALRSQLPADDASVLRLSAVYHNLLRHHAMP